MGFKQLHWWIKVQERDGGLEKKAIQFKEIVEASFFFFLTKYRESWDQRVHRSWSIIITKEFRTRAYTKEASSKCDDIFSQRKSLEFCLPWRFHLFHSSQMKNRGKPKTPTLQRIVSLKHCIRFNNIIHKFVNCFFKG